MFPPHDAEIIRNDAGEILGWSRPAEPDYCDIHGRTFMGVECPECRYEDQYDPNEFDPGPEVDDEGGMSEYRHQLASSGYDVDE